jgi:probable rRNA maturation factor
MKIITEIIKSDIRWQQYKFINKNFVKKITKNIFCRFNSLRIIPMCEFSILLTTNDEMKNFNEQFRNISKPTNVLSFPNLDLYWKNINKFKIKPENSYLGDIAFGYEIILEQSNEYKISFEDHFTHLLVHSLLHLLGFDHIEDDDAEIMEDLEIKILEDFGIESPY